ncbi:MAG: SDR family oxidoreductase [Candidatus Altiarchaeota archaeon]
MSILVTGNNGYIGKILTKLLVEKGYDVIGYDSGYYSDCELFHDGFEIRQITKDIRNVSKKDIAGINAICHLAALSNDPMGSLDPKLTDEINHKATVKLAKLAIKNGVERFIYSSSCSLYGISDQKALTEESPQNPITAYAKSKVDSETDLKKIATKDFSPVFLRNSTAYGLSPLMRFDLVLNNLCGWAYTTGKIKIMSDGTPWRPLVHIGDISKAFLSALEEPQELIHNQAFNVGQNKENYQIRDLANVIKKQLPSCEVEYTYEHGSDSRTYNVSFDKINKTLKTFKPTWDIQKGTLELLDGFRKANLTFEDFQSRCYTRLKQLTFLRENGKLDENLYWVK